MKKLIIILIIILSAVMCLGVYYQRSSSYDQREIEKVNHEMLSKYSSGNDEESVLGIAQQENMQDLPPQIEILYPSKFNDGDTIETDKIQLKFSDDKKVIRATMNDQEISTEEILITTEGLYKIEIQDESNQTSSLLFTLKNKPQESKITTTQKTSAKAAKEKAAREKAAKEQAERKQAAREQAAREKAAREQAEREQAEREQAAKEQAEREQAEKEKAAKEQAEKEKAEREQAEKEKAEKEQAEKEQVQTNQLE